MNKRLLWLIVIIILLLSSFNVIPQIKHSLSKKKSTQEEIIAVNKKIEEIKADIEKYDKKITSLDDEFEKERVARNMFQMVKENEVIYKYVEKNTNNKTEKTEEEK
ncbi:septum formation initiator family protein [Fusobacterium canifelinum]|uniref:Septum formation initiator family protein n=1 Tax=Fusobacterium canifelinum TaxID=285729 RepID=A0A3P1V2M3_9FUSO|nr:septum formation initiator family protein [Fusobacterium canifelinum]QQB73051.1 septum formation initiator family protein [Fusobacterium canifelinum]QQS88646.1 septum formation initiator family protein [Fusobacterium canifelinum]RRD28469.1 septum formation initiator family protein [Fusobacterium canifelinum]